MHEQDDGGTDAGIIPASFVPWTRMSPDEPNREANALYIRSQMYYSVRSKTRLAGMPLWASQETKNLPCSQNVLMA